VPRAGKPQISFADWELLQQGILLEPLLQSISDFLDDHEELIETVRRDLERGLKKPGTGRSGLALPRLGFQRPYERLIPEPPSVLVFFRPAPGPWRSASSTNGIRPCANGRRFPG
jgi:hypothetical protein